MTDKIQTLSGYIHEYQKSVNEPEAFWSRIAENFYWRKKWDKVVEWDFHKPTIKWFRHGKLKIFLKDIFSHWVTTLPLYGSQAIRKKRIELLHFGSCTK